MKITKTILKAVGVLAFWLALWALCAYAVGKPQLVLPYPTSVAKKLAAMLGTGDFYIVCLTSLAKIFIGLVAGILSGVLLAVATKLASPADALVSPAVEVVKATPVASVIILLFFILDSGAIPSLVSALMVVPIMFSNVRRGIETAPENALEVARIYDFSGAKKVRLIYLPSVMPYFTAGCRSALGLAWKAGIAAEVICTPESSIGTMLYNARIYLDAESLFAWTAVVVMMSFVIEKLLIWALGKLLKGGETI